MRHRRRRDAFRSFGKGSLTVSTTVALLAFVATPAAARIDRQALIARHMVRQTRIDSHAPVMLGNGQLGFTADITGLQSFPGRYSELAPLLTMAQWGWHSFPNPTKVQERDGWRMIPVEGRGSQPYAWMQSWADGEKNPAYGWLRANPHRISLGRIALALGEAAPDFADVTETRQQLDLWTGRLTSEFRLRGMPVRVTTVVHPTVDLVAVEIVSPLVARGELGATVRYPGVAPAINPDPSGWTPRATETTRALTRTARSVSLTRTLDDTRYASRIDSDGRLDVATTAGVRIAGGGGDRLRFTVRFTPDPQPAANPGVPESIDATARHWRDFWTKGAAVDFTGSTDARLKLRPDTPQRYENVTFRDITLDNAGGAIVAVEPWTQYRDPRAAAPPSHVRGLSFVRIRGRFGAFGTIRPNPGQTTIDDIAFRDIDVRLTRPVLVADGVQGLRFDRVRVNGTVQSPPLRDGRKQKNLTQLNESHQTGIMPTRAG